LQQNRLYADESARSLHLFAVVVRLESLPDSLDGARRSALAAHSSISAVTV